MVPKSPNFLFATNMVQTSKMSKVRNGTQKGEAKKGRPASPQMSHNQNPVQKWFNNQEAGRTTNLWLGSSFTNLHLPAPGFFDCDSNAAARRPRVFRNFLGARAGAGVLRRRELPGGEAQGPAHVAEASADAARASSKRRRRLVTRLCLQKTVGWLKGRTDSSFVPQTNKGRGLKGRLKTFVCFKGLVCRSKNLLRKPLSNGKASFQTGCEGLRSHQRPAD